MAFFIFYLSEEELDFDELEELEFNARENYINVFYNGLANDEIRNAFAVILVQVTFDIVHADADAAVMDQIVNSIKNLAT